MEIPLDLLKIVASYLVDPKMKLLDWILKSRMTKMNIYTTPTTITKILMLRTNIMMQTHII